MLAYRVLKDLSLYKALEYKLDFVLHAEGVVSDVEGGGEAYLLEVEAYVAVAGAEGSRDILCPEKMRVLRQRCKMPLGGALF